MSRRKAAASPRTSVRTLSGETFTTDRIAADAADLAATAAQLERLVGERLLASMPEAAADITAATHEIAARVADLSLNAAELQKLAGVQALASMPKVRRTLTLDANVVAAFADTESLSAEVNSVLRDEITRREARAELEQFVLNLEAQFGAPDAADVEHFEALLRG